MRTDARSFSRLVFVWFLTLSALSAQTTFLRGPFGFLLNVSFDNPSVSNGTATLGVMNFDGTGNLTGSYTTKNGDTPTQPANTSTGSLTGNYSTNPDGTGSVTINSDNGTRLMMAMLITDGGQGLQLVATNCSCDLSATVLSGFARAAHPGPLKGSYGFQISNSPTPARAQFGLANFDGAGNLTVSLTSVGSGGNSSQPSIGTSTLNGTYSLNSDGSGTLKFPMPDGSTSATAIVVVDGGSQILLLSTDGASRVQLGAARLQ